MTEDPTVTDAAAPAEGAARYCPVCGDAVAARFCPTDGTVTVVRRALKPGDLDYHAGRVVDGRYRVGQRLGHGGFGAVYAAAHTGTGQHVALKVLNVALSSDNAPIVRRFWQEAQVTSRLRHANTVRVFDVGQTEEGAFFLAMELLQGRTLQTRLDDEGPTDEDTAVFIGIEVLKSLNEAHAAGLVHRDLKPANLMLCPGDAPDRPLVKVLDFGIARTADSSLTKTGAALGTPAYMSPEQCRGIPVDGRSDLYALGALLFRCVADRPPFVDENPLTVLFQHADTPPPDVGAVAPQALSPEFCAVVARALAKDPAQRFADAKAMRDALEAPRTAVLPSEAPTRTVRAAPAVATILQALPPVPSPAAHPAAASPAAVATRPRWSRRPILVAVAVTAVAGGAAWLGSQSATVTRSVAEAPTATAPTAGGVPAQPAPTAIPAAAALAPSLTAPPPAAPAAAAARAPTPVAAPPSVAAPPAHDPPGPAAAKGPSGTVARTAAKPKATEATAAPTPPAVKPPEPPSAKPPPRLPDKPVALD